MQKGKTPPERGIDRAHKEKQVIAHVPVMRAAVTMISDVASRTAF